MRSNEQENVMPSPEQMENMTLQGMDILCNLNKVDKYALTLRSLTWHRKAADMNQRIEKNILRRIGKGDLKAFEMLFREYYEPLCRHALKFLQDPDEAEEIVQDLFYGLWEKRFQLRIETSANSYLYAAVHNKCMKVLRHKTVESKFRAHYLANGSETDTSSEITGVSEEVERIMERTLKSLPDRCSKIFRLNRFEGMKYQEIAEKLSISVKTVEANMGKALKLLRKNLKDYTEVD